MAKKVKKVKKRHVLGVGYVEPVDIRLFGFELYKHKTPVSGETVELNFKHVSNEKKYRLILEEV